MQTTTSSETLSPDLAGTQALPTPAPDAATLPPEPLPGSPPPDPCGPRPTSTRSSQTAAFPRAPGETPRAYSAFMLFFQLGHGRSLPAVADQLGENPATVKNWSSRYHWADRILTFSSGLLQQHAEAEAAWRRQQAADWARRTGEQREREWAASQKLLDAAHCFLESFGDREVEKMTLAQVSRALQISSRMARLALSGNPGPEEPSLAPLQLELAAALKKAYSQPAPQTSTIKPRLFIHRRCTRLLDCLPSLQNDPNHPEDVLKVDPDEDGIGGDDPADALRYLVASKPREIHVVKLAGF